MTNLNLFLEIEKHLLQDENPSIFLEKIKNEESFKNSSFNIFLQLDKENQIAKSNPWTHTLNVVNLATKYKDLSSNPKAFMWATLFHEIGKIKTTNSIYPKISGEITRRILREHIKDESLLKEVVALVKHHRAPLFIVNRISYSIIDLIDTADIFDVALLSLCSNIEDENFKEEEFKKNLLNSNKFLKIMSKKTNLFPYEIVI